MSKEENTSQKILTNILLKLEDKGLESRNASVGRIRADYYKGNDFEKSLIDNLDYICQELKKNLNIDIKKEKQEDALNEIYDIFHSNGIIAKAVRIQGDKAKYPKRLFSVEQNLGNTEIPADDVKIESLTKFEGSPKVFYLLNIERSNSKLYFYLITVVIGVLMYCLFPVWPFEVKMAVWWVSYILLMFLLGLNIVRYVLFVTLYIFGIDFWLFPELYDDKKGVLDSFKPLYTYNKREETLITILVRLAIAIVFLYCAVTVYLNPDMIDDLYNHVFEAATDFFDWGKNHVINYHVSDIV
jgi:translocation protein SEC62